MGAGYLADRNEIANPAALNPCTITSNVAWATAAPLEAMKTTPLIDAAVSSTPGTEAAPVVIDFAWTDPIDLTYAGLLDTNLAQSATVRLEAWTDAAMTDLVLRCETNVVPPLVDPATLRFGAANQFRGDLDPRDFRLLPAHVHFPVALASARRLRLSLWGEAIRPDGTADTGYRIGLGWAGDGLTIERDLGGSGEGYRSGDERIETPGGGVWVEPGIGRRVSMIDRVACDRNLRDALFRLSLRVGKHKPLIWLPDVGDTAVCFQYGGIFRRIDDHEHKYIAPRYTNGVLQLEEWRE